MSRYVTFLMLIACLGCGGEDNRKATYPVSGVVYVDGKPADMLAVQAHPVGGIDAVQPTISSAFTDAEGKFSFSTYETGDGIPPGEYRLTFNWGTMNLVSMQYGGPDKLKDRYADPEKSVNLVQVGESETVDVGRIELTTK